jgi:hypothetical protein
MSSSPDSASAEKLGISPHLNQRFSRIKQDYHKRLFNYDKEFNLKTSKSTHREKALRESMLAYTERIRSISNSRPKYDSDDSDIEDTIPLIVRAKHIPKFPYKRNIPRRPASLDELIGKSNLVKQERDRQSKRPKSASRVSPHVSLPSLPNKINGRSHQVKISFVSASDLYDFVDYSLRNRGTKKETLQFLQMEKDILTKKAHANQKRPSAAHPRNSEFPTKTTLPPIDPHKDIQRDDVDEVSVDVSSENIPSDIIVKDETVRSENGKKSPVVPLKIRPNRAKRMKIRQPDLGAIPENDVTSHHSSKTPERTITSPPPRNSPRNVITLDSNLVPIPENDFNNDTGFSGRKKLSKLNHRKMDVNRSNPLGKEVDSLLSNEKRVIDIDDLDIHNVNSNKLKAQKKFKKLIFLRDIQDRK